MFILNFQHIIGILLMAFGLQMLIKAFFGIEVPLFQPLLGLLLMYWGLTLLVSTQRTASKNIYWQTRTYHQEKKDND